MKPELEKKLTDRFMFYKMQFGFECGNGWFDLLWKLSERIEKIIEENNIKDFEAVQVKEKFAGLRYYVSNVSSYEISKEIKKAELKSIVTCELCGKPAVLCSSLSWLQTLCPECVKEPFAPAECLRQEYIDQLPDGLLKQYRSKK